jgi:hypothetical protein
MSRQRPSPHVQFRGSGFNRHRYTHSELHRHGAAALADSRRNCQRFLGYVFHADVVAFRHTLTRAGFEYDPEAHRFRSLFSDSVTISDEGRFIRDLNYRHTDVFTADDLKILLELVDLDVRNQDVLLPRPDRDRRDLTMEMMTPIYVLPHHADVLLKAIDLYEFLPHPADA